MKYVINIVGGLLGVAFIAFSLMYFFKMMPKMPPPPADSPSAHFMAAFGPTGYMTFVKSCELIGGILCMIPLTRNIGLLVLGPVILNIVAFQAFIAKGAGLKDPVLIMICLLAAYLLWSARSKFAALLNR
jgi:putative oxidoreductase